MITRMFMQVPYKPLTYSSDPFPKINLNHLWSPCGGVSSLQVLWVTLFLVLVSPKQLGLSFQPLLLV
ncbi:uncharacterized protein BT62DRAFT_1020738 [Guyanagaster necrorhizus]|uniref:Uncharacterized protein n=1 Tax=Guyanagaster necrorhizus TaxID=856835 RepID=A0A9P7VEG0_9AGAR|nr:uncharacterized protein BT62DRAFT_1020738 [Guyanagaster necrorhizus MCA 3950]KAG7439097.1 hypothetical protein BT62DRAFT_1020738 [Guyanagaster necrorhizus MCA 3950]